MSAALVLAAATVLGTASLGAVTVPLTSPVRRPHADGTSTTSAARSAVAVRAAIPRAAPLRTGGRSPRTGSPPVDATTWATLLDHVSTHLRSGDSLITAWTTAIGECAIVGEAVTPGRSVADTIAGTTTDPDEAVVVQAIAAAAALGGPMAATIDAAAALLRERASIRAEALAHSAQARLSARVLTAVPLVFAAWSTVTSGSFRNSLATPIGFGCIALGGVLNLVGWRWMRRIVTGTAR